MVPGPQLADLGLADPRGPLEQQGLSQRLGEKQRRSDLVAGDEALLTERGSDPLG